MTAGAGAEKATAGTGAGRFRRMLGVVETAGPCPGRCSEL